MTRRLGLVLIVPIAVFAFLGTNLAAAMAAPANDNFADRQTISGALPITAPANNIGATAEAGEPDIFTNAAQKSVWFSWTAPAAESMVIDLCGSFTGDSSTPFISMAVRTGVSLPALVLIKETAGNCLLRFQSVAAVTYNFQIDYRNNEGNFTLKLRRLAPPSNDAFASPIVLGPALPLSQNATTVDSSWEVGEPAGLGGSSQSRSVWFSWTAPLTGRVRLSLCEKTAVDGALNDSTRVYTGATLPTLAEVAALTSNDCVMDFPVTNGTAYRIAVSGSFSGEFNFLLGLSAAPAPANDDFADAQVIGPGLPISTSGNNDFATEEAGEPNHGGYPDTSRSVWFSWTAGQSGPVRLKACNQDLRLFTSVYTGNMINALTEVGERFYYSPCSNFFDAVAGTTYRIAVAGAPFSGTHGPFTLELRQVAIPANDAFASAIGLGSGLTVSTGGTTVDSTLEDNEPDHSGYFGDQGGSVWYRWTAPNDNAVILSACSPGEPNRIAVYRSDPEVAAPTITDLIQIDNDGEACRDGTKGGRLAIAPVKGSSYMIAISPLVPDYESPFTLEIKGTTDSAKPKPAPFNLKKAIAKCKKIKGKGKKAKRKRANCIKAARKKAAVIKCQKITNKKKRTACVKKARKRFK